MTTTQHVPQTDHQIQSAIIAELAWMPSISHNLIGVAISDGAVTLSGQVQTFPEKKAAVRAAFRVPGVIAVADEIEIHNSWTPRADTDIAREATEFLESTLLAPTGKVQAEVHQHVVMLTGVVEWQYQRESIGRAVSKLPGVHGVSNSITLKPHGHIEAGAAKAKIADAFRRNATIDAERIHIEVAGDRITLTGNVATWAEHDQANHAAWGTPGVVHVDNKLHVVR